MQWSSPYVNPLGKGKQSRFDTRDTSQQRNAQTKSSVCPQPTASEPQNGSASPHLALSASMPQDHPLCFLLNTVCLTVKADNGRSVNCQAILDFGSQIGIITKKIVQQLCISSTLAAMRIQLIGNNINKTKARINVMKREYAERHGYMIHSDEFSIHLPIMLSLTIKPLMFSSVISSVVPNFVGMMRLVFVLCRRLLDYYNIVIYLIFSVRSFHVDKSSTPRKIFTFTELTTNDMFGKNVQQFRMPKYYSLGATVAQTHFSSTKARLSRGTESPLVVFKGLDLLFTPFKSSNI
uniref:Peptidase aspartic putative domain-containing protein n=1 Tax=Glossina austeni TaxID=7395 RepID=A0A1A9V102_GLOAU